MYMGIFNTQDVKIVPLTMEFLIDYSLSLNFFFFFFLLFQLPFHNGEVRYPDIKDVKLKMSTSYLA